MNDLGPAVLLLFICLVLIFGLSKKTRVFECFTQGAADGLQTAKSVFPSILALVFAVGLLRSSGVLELLCSLLRPIAEKLGFPSELLPLCLISPISGSGSLAMFESLLRQYGADSFIGRAASVIAGSTETTFYAIAVYYGAAGIKKIRHTVFASLCADFTSFILAVLTVRLFFYQ